MRSSKVGIITLHGNNNYGNKLQNYALQEVLKGLDLLVHTLILSEHRTVRSTLFSRFRTLFRQTPSKSIDIVTKRIGRNRYYNRNKELLELRTNVFKQFSHDYLSERFYKLDSDKVTKINDEYDYFVTGSDQVWNPIYISNMDNYFLTFAEENKRVAYAASFSCPRLPEQHKEKYREWLKEMSKISVREEEGADIIRELISLKVPVLVDPTLLLNKKQWLSIANKASNRPEEGYILTYFLGEISASTEQYIQNLAQEKKMQIIRLGDISDKDTFMTGPREFVDYINNADILLTDSFHGVVFSILLETPFIVYERKTNIPTMYSRIETLLDKFDLRHREAKNISGDVFAADYAHVYDLLEAERNRSFKYLREALGIGDDKTHES